MVKSLLNSLDEDRVKVTFGAGTDAELFAAITKHIELTGYVAETITLYSGSKMFMADVEFYTGKY